MSAPPPPPVPPTKISVASIPLKGKSLESILAKRKTENTKHEIEPESNKVELKNMAVTTRGENLPPNCYIISTIFKSKKPLPPPSSTTSFKVATFNVLFDIGKTKQISYAELRYQKQLEILRQQNADVICLNEVTYNYVSMVLADEYFTSTYDIVVDPNVLHYKNDICFGNMVLSKLPLDETNCYCLVWRDINISHRPGIVANVTVGGTLLSFIAVHFKAYQNMHETRKSQFDDCTAVHDFITSQNSAECFILGDFNLENSFEQKQENLPKGYLDLWPLLHHSTDTSQGVTEIDDGYTFDGRQNGTIQIMYAGYTWKNRLDRVFFKGAKAKPLSITMFANEAVFDKKFPAPSEKIEKLMPSDHFGLLVEFGEVA